MNRFCEVMIIIIFIIGILSILTGVFFGGKKGIEWILNKVQMKKFQY